MGSTTVQQPTPPNPGQTYSDVLQSQINLAPQQFSAASQFDPQYAQLYSNILSNSLLGTPGADGTRSGGLLDTYSQAAPITQGLQNQLNTQQLNQNLTNLQSLAPGAVSAFQNSNPLLGQVQGAMANQAIQGPQYGAVGAPDSPLKQLASWNSPQMNVQAPTMQAANFGGTPQTNAAQLSSIPMTGSATTGAAQMGGSPLIGSQSLGWNPFQSMQVAGFNPALQQLDQTAQQQLALGGRLSGQEMGDISNQVLSSFNTMGRAQDPAAAATLALNLDSAQQARLAQREGVAAGVSGLYQNQAANQLQAQGMALQGATTQAGLGQTASLANQGVLQQTGLANLSNAQQSGLFNAANQQQSFLANQQASLQGGMFNAANQQQASLANQQAQMQAQQINAQNRQAAALANQQTQMQAQLANQNAFMQQQGMTLQGAQSNAAQQLQAQMANQATAFGAQQLQAQMLSSANQGLLSSTMPALQMVLNPSGAMGQTGGLMGQAGGLPTGSQNFSPFGVGTQLYQDYYNAGNNANITNATTNAGMIGGGMSAVGAIGSAAMMKIMFTCIPSDEFVDTPNGPRPIQEIEPGDFVIGYGGKAVEVLQAHRYKENPDEPRFLEITLDNGTELTVCDMHRIDDVRSGQYRPGDEIGGKRIVQIERKGGVTRSFDLLTEDRGYRMGGVPVNSMIQEMAGAIASLEK